MKGQREYGNFGATPLPLSGLKTPYVNTSRREDLGVYLDSYGTGSDNRTQTGEMFLEKGLFDRFTKRYDPYPAWSQHKGTSISPEEIESIFIQLTEIFGFQYDSTKNMYDYLLRLLDSRASRLGPIQALRSLHADYIGGVNSNFRKWYFAAQLDVDDSVGFNMDAKSKPDKRKSNFTYSFEQAENQWHNNMVNLSPTDCVIQLALYLLCWGEANNLRFMPECLCFLYKCCNDYYYSLDVDIPIRNITPSFLDHAITPLYKFYRDQSYHLSDGKYYHNDKDHKNIIGYDDMNQLFWYRQGLEKIVLSDKSKLMALSPGERYARLHEVSWKKVFYKTFIESRSWSHTFANFSRIWIIHISMFWYYTTYNSPTLYTLRYQQALDNQPTIQARLLVMSLAGAISVLISLVSTIYEFSFVPRKWPGCQPLFKRLMVLVLILVICVSPSAYIFGFFPLNVQTKLGVAIAVVQFAFSIFVVIYLSVVPLGKVFSNYPDINGRKYLPTKYFTSAFYSLNGTSRVASYGLWLTIFFSKFLESYFFLTLSLRDPVRVLSGMKMLKCAGEAWIGKSLCINHALIVLTLIYLTDLVLFFLDTYLWYIVWNAVFSVFRSFYIGVSIWTPWRNIFSRLPKRIFSKIITSSTDKDMNAKIIVSQIWNSIIISMYRDHLLSIDHVQKLIYKQVSIPGQTESTILKEPTFFVSQEDEAMKSALFYQNSEAQRRITFFAQSLSTPMPEVGSVDMMPSFTVLIPHYGEKITLSLREIIREEEQYSHVTMLEYLKQLHPLEWSCFVRDTKLLAEEFDSDTASTDFKSKLPQDDLPYYSVGFKVATPEYILRTRIWASLRCQTLYRTISGFMNYSRAIKLIYDVENLVSEDDKDDELATLEEASVMAIRKFRMIVCMQRLKHFTTEEIENTEFLLRAYPDLQISYLDEELDSETKESVFYSVLIDGSCPILESGERRPKYRIKLSGNPILGDGKSDNQNHSLIFCRGEYIQLIDANQDNYIEECLKIRSVLAEFEETILPLDPYNSETDYEYSHPVAIIGTREYIYSENIGILGDVAAGKEQTFGTLFARTLAHIGGKLHYGHPDFLNSVFMTTRGGVSKAQKGLHLNEDIYAGMNAVLRGGRIKHCEYMQCGKGRDLGFGSILNFTTKIGAGMGEQMLSREYFYLSTQLLLHRFLSFYYAHPGFHLNNVFIILSIKLFLLVAANLAALTNESTICEYDKFRPITDPNRPLGCYNLIPVVQWLERCIFSIFIVFLISFIPLVVQELTERGVYKSFSRLFKHFASFSPLFEVFVCTIYAESLVSDIAYGGARYIATGRGFATVRVPFSSLYSRFAKESLYFGAMASLLILYCSIGMWKLPLVYFWITIIGLLLCPCLYNPSQFSWDDFFLDYKEYIKWLHRGNSSSRVSSWIGFTRLARSRIIGVKHKRVNSNEEIKTITDVSPSRFRIMISESFYKLGLIIIVGFAYLFANAQNDSRSTSPSHSLLRILIFSFVPILINILLLVTFFVVSIVLGPLFTFIFGKFPSLIATIVHILAFVNYVVFFELLWFCQNFDFSRTVLGVCLGILIQGWFLNMLTMGLVSREFRHDRSNRSWWSGKWITAGLGWNMFTQPVREFFCKTAELSYFVGDVTLGHFILFAQFPILLIPYADKWHSLMLFWLEPGSQIRPRVLSKRQKRARKFTGILYFLIFLVVLCLFASIFAVPLVATNIYDVDFEQYIPEILAPLIQPYTIINKRKGLHKNLYKNVH